ncbi:MAG: hypothetical protein K2Q24_15145 [Chitinophagaceae bacterium]|jgi:hypothetical protein|nr:hypothetical protein [Chitinophagaceae bacterium]
MKNILFTLFKILIAFVLVGKFLNWFLDFNDRTNQMLNSTMFTLIGITYIVMGNTWQHPFKKMTIITCGVYLIGMNFFNKHTALDIIGIICILVPMLIARFYKEDRTTAETLQN